MRAPIVKSQSLVNLLIGIVATDGSVLGAPLDHESAITLEYRRNDQADWTAFGTLVSFTPAALAANGFRHDFDKYYEICPPLDAFAGGQYLSIRWSGTGIKSDLAHFPINEFDHQNNTRGATQSSVDTVNGLIVGLSALLGDPEGDSLSEDVSSLDAAVTELIGTVGDPATASIALDLAAILTAIGNIDTGGGGGSVEGDVNVVSFSQSALTQLAAQKLRFRLLTLINGSLSETIIQGSAYLASRGLAIEIPISQPALTGSTVSLIAESKASDGPTFTISGSVVVNGESVTVARFEPTSAQTAGFAVGDYVFSVKADFGDGEIVYLPSGHLTVKSPAQAV